MTESGYRAFISYSHRDAAAAQALHRRLEAYRVPRRLAGTIGEHGPIPRRLAPIFRDRDELPAAGDLSEKVRAALAVSHSLIILCSPHAAASPWVAREIEAFRELNPGRPILAAILEGEPADCFPAVLSAGAEPLAADLRRSGDGRRLGFLKLVAGVTGVGLDALVQRDSARAIRRVTAVTLVALAITLVMAVLTVVALNARREAEGQRAEAERQRGEAEGMVEFMLTDLRTKLQGVGRLDIMDAVNARAIAYYGDRQALDRLSDDSLERRARLLHRMGEDKVAQGDIARALIRFREAYATTAATLARHPDDPKAIFAHAQSEYWIGATHQQRGEWLSARRYFARYAEAGKRLVAIEPQNPTYMMERAWGPLNLGIVALNLKNPRAAKDAFADAILWFEQVARLTPKDAKVLTELANAYAWLADSYYVRNQFPPSLDARLHQARIAERLVALDPSNAQYIYDLARAERGLGVVASVLGEWTIAKPKLDQARQRLQWLAAHDPKNALWADLKAAVDCDVFRAANRIRFESASRRHSSGTRSRRVSVPACPSDPGEQG